MLQSSTRIHPLLLFLVVGVLLFIWDEWRNPDLLGAKQIKLASAKIEQFEKVLIQRYGRPPTKAQLDAEIRAYIDEELLYRQALRLGLHLNDEIVRRRLAQTMAFIIEGKADFESPSDTELRAWYDQTDAVRESLSRFNFSHIFFSSDRHQGQAAVLAAKTLDLLVNESISATAVGDPFLLGRQFRSQTIAKLSENFGQSFADAIINAPSGQWSGPVSSKYGSHLVLLEKSGFKKQVDFERQRVQLVNAWRMQRRREVREQALNQLREEFEIALESRPQQQLTNL